MADQLAADLVAGFDALFGPHPAVRAAHAKGICCVATFTATPEAAGLTVAPHMQGAPTPVTVRFSHGSGDPGAKDAGREPRGMAVKFHLGGRAQTDIVSINQPVFITRTPEEFLEFVRLRTPDPATGQIDLAALGAFVGARPESQRAAQILLAAVPLESFLRTRYFAIHAFRFVAADGSARYGRYRWDPDAGVGELTKEAAEARPDHYLREDLIERLSAGPASFTLHVQLAGDGDDPSDPTAEWPPDRPEIVAGRLEITGVAADQEKDCEALLFDPTRLCDGIEPSNDPVLAARPPAYAISVKRRLKARR
jgi:catalase